MRPEQMRLFFKENHDFTFLYHNKTLQHIATAFFSKRVGFLRTKPDKQAVLLLVVGDVLDDVLGSLGNQHPLEGCLTAQLLRYSLLLLQRADHHVHNGGVGKAYFVGGFFSLKIHMFIKKMR